MAGIIKASINFKCNRQIKNNKGRKVNTLPITITVNDEPDQVW